jgi:hypothetical protein
MAPGIGRVGIYKVPGFGLREGLAEVSNLKSPINGTQNLGDLTDLVGDFRDVCLGKPFRFMAVRNVEFSLPIEADDAVEARTVKEEKIKGRWRFIALRCNRILDRFVV